MKIDELIDLARSRRSIRKFKPDPIPDGTVEKMIELARWAPSGANSQPWEFIVVKDAVTRRKMAELHAQIRPEQYYIEQTRVEDLRHNMLKTFPEGLPSIDDAPLLIVVCGDRRVVQTSVLSAYYLTGEGGPDGVYLKNMANATYSLLLAATAMGLGSEWFSVIGPLEEMLKPVLGVPPFIQIHTIVPVGYPADQPAQAYRRPCEEMIHHERFDMSRFRRGDQVVEYIRTLRRGGKPAVLPSIRSSEMLQKNEFAV